MLTPRTLALVAVVLLVAVVALGLYLSGSTTGAVAVAGAATTAAVSQRASARRRRDREEVADAPAVPKLGGDSAAKHVDEVPLDQLVREEQDRLG